METVAVIDFETTGMSPAQGARATEIAAVLVQEGQVVGRFQSLMNSGAWVPPFIEQLTGISNAMLQSAPPARAVMHELARFTRGCGLVAHNAAFDRNFWQAEQHFQVTASYTEVSQRLTGEASDRSRGAASVGSDGANRLAILQNGVVEKVGLPESM